MLEPETIRSESEIEGVDGMRHAWCMGMGGRSAADASLLECVYATTLYCQYPVIGTGVLVLSE